jgi:hypothetical protein
MTSEDRQRLHELMHLLISHRGQLDYPVHDVRGPKDAATFALNHDQAVHRLTTGGRLMFDCSEAATCLFKWTKPLHDPNGLGYAHAGYTGTMLAHLPHYSDAKRARVGALAVFGPGTGVHVAVCLEPDPKHGDPELFSHGAEQAAGPIRLQVLAAALPGPVTWLNVSGL